MDYKYLIEVKQEAKTMHGSKLNAQPWSIWLCHSLRQGQQTDLLWTCSRQGSHNQGHEPGKWHCTIEVTINTSKEMYLS